MQRLQDHILFKLWNIGKTFYTYECNLLSIYVLDYICCIYFIHSFIHSFIHTYILTYIRTLILTHVHACVLLHALAATAAAWAKSWDSRTSSVKPHGRGGEHFLNNIDIGFMKAGAPLLGGVQGFLTFWIFSFSCGQICNFFGVRAWGFNSAEIVCVDGFFLSYPCRALPYRTFCIENPKSCPNRPISQRINNRHGKRHIQRKTTQHKVMLCGLPVGCAETAHPDCPGCSPPKRDSQKEGVQFGKPETICRESIRANRAIQVWTFKEDLLQKA